MSPSGFRIVSDYCFGKGKGESVRNSVYCLYKKHLESALAGQQNPTPETVHTVKATLLTNESLDKYIMLAERMLDDAYRTAIRPYERKNTWSEFFVSSLASTVGALLYSALLLILFVLGKDQIRSWLHSLEGDKPAVVDARQPGGDQKADRTTPPTVP